VLVLSCVHVRRGNLLVSQLMDVFAVPIEGRYILYRPLLRLAFVGNKAMADAVLALAGGKAREVPDSMEQARTFLEQIGFLEPDPPPPPAPDSDHPTTAVLLLTNRCNLRCSYCYASGGEGAPRDLPLAAARAVIDCASTNAKKQGHSHFTLTFHGGGEPVQAWGTLTKAMSYARSRDVECRASMVSNGVWSARQREWVLANLDVLTISLDGRPETHDSQRPFASGRGSHRSVMRTIEALDSAGRPYGIRLTATAPWRDRLVEDVRFICEETGCKAMMVEPAFNTERGCHQAPTTEQGKEFAGSYMAAYEVARRAGRSLTYSGARPWILTRAFCTAPYGAVVVNPDGHLVGCYEVTDKEHLLSDISTVGHVNGSRVVFDQKRRSRLLRFLERRRSLCRDCFCYWHCAGDCYPRYHFGQAAAGSGLNTRCAINREITARIILWHIMASDGVWRGLKPDQQEIQLLRAF
jgi:uncharacterized protein